jgi:hypothetical protein
VVKKEVILLYLSGQAPAQVCNTEVKRSMMTIYKNISRKYSAANTQYASLTRPSPQLTRLGNTKAEKGFADRSSGRSASFFFNGRYFQGSKVSFLHNVPESHTLLSSRGVMPIRRLINETNGRLAFRRGKPPHSKSQTIQSSVGHFKVWPILIINC